jgi:hypothetical protein
MNNDTTSAPVSATQPAAAAEPQAQVVFVPAKGTTDGSIIAKYENPEFGYVQLQQKTVSIVGGWIREHKKSCLVRGKIAELQAFVKAFSGATKLPGKIAVQEYVESAVPEAVKKQFLSGGLEYEKAIAGFVKQAGQDGINLMKDGERILRFSSYDPTGKVEEFTIQHDNVEEVAAWNALRKEAKADLGG